MEGKEATEQAEGRQNHDWTQRRNWTRRLEGVKYERFSALNGGGEPRIFFAFSLPPGQDRVDDAVYAIMKDHQTTEKGYPTGLKYSTDLLHGKTWNLRDDEHGRSTADRIDRKLKALAHKQEQEQPKGR